MPTPLPVTPYSLRYPNEILYQTTDWFSVGISSYVPGSLLGSSNVTVNATPQNQVTSNPETGAIISSLIILPMPSNIQDGNSVNYSDDSLNRIAAGALNGIEALQNITLDSNFLKSTDDAFNKVQSEFTKLGAGNLLGLLKKSLSAEALSVFGGNISINSLLARESGQILNPNMELLFNGVTLRTFRFSFKMTPRDNDESNNVKNIIRTLKKNMAAKGQQGGTFLSTPNVFTLAYKKGSGDHPFLHKFKPCFLKDMSVNYTGENVYTTYSDGTPVSMTMDLTFQEMFPIYEKDYDKFSNDAPPNFRGVGF